MDIQQAITILIVVVASLFLGRHLYKSVQTKDGDTCGGCGGCGKPMPVPDGVRPAPQTTPLITLSAPPQRLRVSRVSNAEKTDV